MTTKYISILTIIICLSLAVLSQNCPSIHQEEFYYYKNTGINGLEFQEMNQAVVVPREKTLRNCELEKIVFGWHPYWANGLEINYDWSLLSDLSYFGYEVNPYTGEAYNTYNWSEVAVVDAALSAGLRVNLCVILFNNHQIFFDNPDAVQTLITNLISLVQSRGAHGVNIDFEAVPFSQKDNLTNFVISLSTQMKAAIPGAHISIALPAVDWSGTFDVGAMLDHIDLFLIMGYDYYYGGSGQAGPTDPLYTHALPYDRNLSRSTTYYLNQGIPESKLAMGLPYYGREWETISNEIPTNTTGNFNASRTYKVVQDNVSGNYSNPYFHKKAMSILYSYQESGNWRQCYINNVHTLGKRYNFVNNRNLAGIGIWALSYDDGYSELWDLIEKKFTNCAIVPCQDTIYDMGGPEGNYYNNENYTYTISPTGSSGLSLNFTDFSLNSSGDTLKIYDGNSVYSPLIGSYTGINSPGQIIANGNALTISFQSTSNSPSSGWRAVWDCDADIIPPTTDIHTNRDWYGNDFKVTFDDADNEGGSGVKYAFYQVMDFDGSEWRSNADYGFFNDNFTNAVHPEWTNIAGTWSIDDGHLLQSNQTLSNTNLYAEVEQNQGEIYLYHWQMKIGGSGTNRRAGMHFFCSDSEQNNRENSYMVFFRVDSDKVQLYRYDDNTMNLVTNDDTEVNLDQWYDIKIILNTNTGEISAYKDNQLVSSWIDPDPLSYGNSISLRTADCEVKYNDVKVYVARDVTEIISVGEDASNMIRCESENTDQHAAKIHSMLIDNANNWSESYNKNLFIDFTAPETESVVENDWQTENFLVQFNDTDDLSGIDRRYYQVADFDGENWHANSEYGFYKDNFENLNTAWTSEVGTWQIQDDVLVQTDESEGNTNIHSYLRQDLSNRYLYEFDMKIEGSGENLRAGFHYFCDDPEQSNRGNSYFIWFREATQDLEFYRVEDNIFSLEKHYKIDFEAGEWYNIKLIFDRVTGEKFVYMDNVLVGEWTDPNLWSLLEHENHSYISFRSGNCIMSINNFNVYRTRLPEVTVNIGDENSMIRYQNSNPESSSAVVKSIVTDLAQNLSEISYHNINVDWTEPYPVAYVNDGYGADIDITYNLEEISANWAESTDPHSGIARYFYAVGTSPGATDLINWTDNGLNVSFINTDITLIEDETYYTSVISENGAGLQSEVTSSDGVLAAVLVEPVEPDCPADFELCLNDEVFQLSGAEPNGGIYSGNGVSGNINFNPDIAGIGTHTITYDYYGEICTFEITVKDIPTLVCPEDLIVLNTDETIILSGALPEGGTYYLNQQEITEFNPSDYSIEDYIIEYHFYDENTDCSNTCSFTITIELDVNKTISESSSINIYPNPNYGNFTIEFNNISGVVQYEIIDNHSRIIMSGKHFSYKNSKKQIELNVAKGVYYIKLFNGELVKISKILIN